MTILPEACYINCSFCLMNARQFSCATNAFQRFYRQNCHVPCFIPAAYELWFKQILFEIDSIRELFIGRECLAHFKGGNILDERRMLEIIKRMHRCCKIMKAIRFNKD